METTVATVKSILENIVNAYDSSLIATMGAFEEQHLIWGFEASLCNIIA
jgi:hypothetical protein